MTEDKDILEMFFEALSTPKPQLLPKCYQNKAEKFD